MYGEGQSFKCPMCGEITVGRDYCPECGDPLILECKQCGIEWRLWLGIKLCPYCGARVRRRVIKASGAGRTAAR